MCAAVEAGVRRAVPHAEVAAVPMADGGEGTLDCFLRARGGDAVEVAATDPLGRPVKAPTRCPATGGPRWWSWRPRRGCRWWRTSRRTR